MALGRYGSRRVRFTWRGRSVKRSDPRSPKVLLDCKNQRSFGGKCVFFAVCTALEAHKRLKTGQPCPNLSWEDLNTKVLGLPGNRAGVEECFAILRDEGVRYEGSEDTVKVKDFEKVSKSKDDIENALKTYMKEAPMLGTFEVFGDEFNEYGRSEHADVIYMAYRIRDAKSWTHVVVITGFGVQGIYPFWEFQNSYGPRWRGAARGFGQIYAIHLHWLYGFTLA